MKNKDYNYSYFYSLKIEGISCFKDSQLLNLSSSENYSQWTIILGDNGTGKTTLIRVLDRMKPDTSFNVDLSKYDITFLNKKNYFPYFFYGGLENEYKKDLLSELQLKKIKLDLELFNIKSKSKFNVKIDTVENRNTIYNEDFSSVFLLSYGASRKMSKSQNLRTSVSKFSSSLFDDSIELINAEEWFLQKEWAVLKSVRKTKSKFENEFNFVKNLLIDILPDVEDIVSKTVDENNSKPKIEVKTPYGWVNIRDLSYGYQTITALLVDIAANMLEKYPESDNPLAEPVIILIDEIDLHLHPKWQRNLIEKLSYHFPKAQFIVTAHSPLIVQAAQDKNANIVVCRKEGDKVVIDNNPESVKGWRIDQILTSDLFEVESSQSIKIEEIRKEKINILLKEKLDSADKNRLKIINEKLNNVPIFSNKESIDAESLIRKAAELLKK
ncbi:AAA family ATPase [Flavobacterium sp.]|uniref:AAA family ATPase n=1 Tax=Flavobacterium sp. TaxID=239 RepID=UPI0039E5DEFF